MRTKRLRGINFRPLRGLGSVSMVRTTSGAHMIRPCVSRSRSTSPFSEQASHKSAEWSLLENTLWQLAQTQPPITQTLRARWLYRAAAPSAENTAKKSDDERARGADSSSSLLFRFSGRGASDHGSAPTAGATPGILCKDWKVPRLCSPPTPRASAPAASRPGGHEAVRVSTNTLAEAARQRGCRVRIVQARSTDP